MRVVTSHQIAPLRLVICLFGLIALAACQPSTPATPSVAPFPTVTVGRVIEAVLPPRLDAGNAALSNPATALALASRPTPTPNVTACPTPNAGMMLAADRPSADRLDTALLRFLAEGGTLVTLETGLRAWGVITNVGGVRGDLDLTGEGTPEIIIRYAIDNEGILLIVGCLEGGVIDRYRAVIGQPPPDIISIVDANVNGLPDLLFSGQTCDPSCTYRAQMVTWLPAQGRFVNLIADPLINGTPPTLEDIDDDRVGEVVARQISPGDATTGPLRTGMTVWDWDGASYVRSITQLDPPRFRIQALHEADAAFAVQDFAQAIALYQRAADDPALENWLPDDAVTLKAYALYRLLITTAYTDDSQRVGFQARLLTEYPDVAAAPPYVQMGLEFANGLQVTNNLRAGCGEVLEVVNARLDAVGLLNRYGSSAPVYTLADLCPF